MNNNTSITINYLDSNILTGSSDKFRTAIGMYWEPHRYTINNVDTVSLNFPLSPEAISHPYQLTKLSDVLLFPSNYYNLHNIVTKTNNSKPNPNSDMFEVLAKTRGTVSSESLVVSLKVPIRLVGMKEKFHDDKHWKTYLQGGTFFTSSYPGVVSLSTYDVYNYTTQAPYSLLEAKNLYPVNYIGLSSYNIQSTYKHHYREYESKANTLPTPLLLPNAYILDSIRQEAAAGSSADLYNIMGPELMDYACLNLDSGQVVNLMKGASTPYLPPYTIDETSMGSYLEQGLPGQYFDKTKNLRDFLTGTFVHNSVKEETANYVTTKFRNLMFTDETIKRHYTGPHMRDNVLDRLPMYVSLSIPRNPGQRIATAIQTLDYEDLFLSLLRKEFETGVNIRQHETVASTTMQKVNELGNLDTVTTLAPESHKSIDFLKMILNAAKTGYEPSNVDQFYLEPSHTPNALGLLNQNGAYRFSHSMPAMKFLKTVIHELNNTPFYSDLNQTGGRDWEAPIAANEFMSLKLWTLAASEVETTSEGLRYEIDPSGGGMAVDVNSQRHGNDIFTDTSPGSETLAYRIEKIGRQTLPNGTVAETVLQNVYFTNNNSLGLNLEYYDSQVLSGQTYRYNVYEYKLVKGYKYRYSDLRVTNLIANNIISDTTYSILTEDLSLTPYTTAEVQNCLEFRDPQTGTAVPALVELNSQNLAVSLISNADGVGLNQAATTAQVRSPQRYLADFNIEIEPSYKLIELPYATKELMVIDNPPHSPDVTPYQRMDDSQIIGFYINKDAPIPISYPTVLNAAEARLKYNYLNSKNLTEQDLIKLPSASQARYLEIYRIEREPNSITDFSNSLILRKDLKLKDYNKAHKNCFFEEKVRTNKKYYYIFRFVNENEIPGKWSPIQVVELVNDGGYKYAKFETIYQSSFSVFSDLVTTAPLRKLMRLPPAALQTSFEESKVDYTKEAYTQYDNLKIGKVNDPLWGRAFKIRLTSKKTGNKIDLNVTYRLKEESKGGS